MTDEQLNEIEARANAATAGPWVCSAPDEDGDTRVYSSNGHLISLAIFVNAVFIAGSRQDILALLTEVHRLQAENEDREAENEDLRQQADGAYSHGYRMAKENYKEPI